VLVGPLADELLEPGVLLLGLGHHARLLRLDGILLDGLHRFISYVSG
jgi:hypothetical protein